jgi:hypothetical protein
VTQRAEVYPPASSWSRPHAPARTASISRCLPVRPRRPVGRASRQRICFLISCCWRRPVTLWSYSASEAGRVRSDAALQAVRSNVAAIRASAGRPAVGWAPSSAGDAWLPSCPDLPAGARGGR